MPEEAQGLCGTSNPDGLPIKTPQLTLLGKCCDHYDASAYDLTRLLLIKLN